MPSLFKERLFVHLSRCCEVRYCIVRHVGFLVGHGRPAGDATVLPQTVQEVIALLSRPVPDSRRLADALSLLEAATPNAPIPELASELEGALLDVLTILFVDPRGAARARSAISHAFGDTALEILTAFLESGLQQSKRSNHFWI